MSIRFKQQPFQASGCQYKLMFLSAFVLLFVCNCGFSQKTILHGTVKQSDGSPLRNSAVMLIQYNPATKLFTVVDSTYTDASGNYRFDGSMQYYILAKPDEIATSELPTYYGNTIFLQKAIPVQMNYADPLIAEFSTIKKAASNQGAGALGGSVWHTGKTEKNVLKNVTVFLADKDKNTIAATVTDALGNFKFNNLTMGDYFVMIDVLGVDNYATDVINLNVYNPQKNNLHFRIEDGVLLCEENNYSSIKDALKNKENVYVLNLNSLQHDVAEKSLVISSDGNKMVMSQIGEFVNLESLSMNINMINLLPAEIGKLIKLTTLSLNLNKLTSLPPEMATLKNLKVLNLGKNNFNKFPDIITGYSNLEVLNFENNPISLLPASIGALKNLKELNLAGCYDLLEIPPQIGELIQLETLNLSNCVKLKMLPKELNNLKNLKVLDITGTKLNAKAFQKAVPGCEVRATRK